jgi:hypothetical protein
LAVVRYPPAGFLLAETPSLACISLDSALDHA